MTQRGPHGHYTHCARCWGAAWLSEWFWIGMQVQLDSLKRIGMQVQLDSLKRLL